MFVSIIKLIHKQLFFRSRNMSAWTWKKRGLNSLQSDALVNPEKDFECAPAMELEIN